MFLNMLWECLNSVFSDFLFPFKYWGGHSGISNNHRKKERKKKGNGLPSAGYIFS